MEINFYRKNIEKFIRSLEKPTIAKVLRTLDLLERFGHRLGMPHSKALAPGIFELRVRGIQEIRLLYTFHKDSVVILNGLIKKSNKLPSKELEMAIKRKTILDHS